MAVASPPAFSISATTESAASAADFLRAQPWSNGKVGIYGYSYGGIQSMAAIARAPDAFDAAVPMAGIYDFADAYTNADRLGKIFIRTGLISQLPFAKSSASSLTTFCGGSS